MADLFADYSRAMAKSSAYDEMFTPDAQPREIYGRVDEVLASLNLSDVEARSESMARTFLDRGVTFDFAGEERAWPLDVVPRIISGTEWSGLSAGVAQRVRALEAFLNDVYDRQEVVRDGVIPRSLITTSAHFHRAVHGFSTPGGVRVHISGIDLVRDDSGTFRVLEDNVRVPSGVSYVLENRRAIAKGLPEALTGSGIQPVEEYPRRLLSALRKTAPDGVDDPTVVVLTPGVYNSAYFEHTLLAGMMGVELVEGRDLICRSDRVYMRTTEGEQRVDVIYKRLDDDFLDPLQFRSDSMLGVPGVVNAARAGHVTIANAVGNGVADDKLVYTYVPDIIRYYLSEEPIIPNVDTYRVEEPEAREEVMDRLDELVLKPVDGSGGKGLVIGPQASREELEELRRKVLSDPRGWIAQPVLQLSTVPTLSDSRLGPRHVDLRPFAVNDGEEVWVLPGGLTRVALEEGSLVVNSSQGGGSKDTWILDDESVTEPEPGHTRRRAVPRVWPSTFNAVAESVERVDEQQQQSRQRDLPPGAPSASTSSSAPPSPSVLSSPPAAEEPATAGEEPSC